MKTLGKWTTFISAPAALVLAFTWDDSWSYFVLYPLDAIVVVGFLFYLGILPAAAVETWAWLHRNRVPADPHWLIIRDQLRLIYDDHRKRPLGPSGFLRACAMIKKALGERPDLTLEQFGHSLHEIDRIEQTWTNELVYDTSSELRNALRNFQSALPARGRLEAPLDRILEERSVESVGRVLVDVNEVAERIRELGYVPAPHTGVTVDT